MTLEQFQRMRRRLEAKYVDAKGRIIKAEKQLEDAIKDRDEISEILNYLWHLFTKEHSDTIPELKDFLDAPEMEFPKPKEPSEVMNDD